jgi:hypothetical protein
MLLLGSGGHFLLERGHQATVDVGGNCLRFQALVNLDGPLRGVENYPAIGAFFNMFMQGCPDGGVQRIVQEIA